MKFLRFLSIIFCFITTLFILVDGSSEQRTFFYQSCTDIRINFEKMSDMKCMQLIPKPIRYLQRYAFKNYILIKNGSCYDVVSLDSSSTVLFNQVCSEPCIEPYVILFNNQTNNTIYNIFFSPSSQYMWNDSSNMSNHDIRDYPLFDTCQQSIEQEKKLMIIIYVFIGVTTLLVVSCIILCCACCQLRQRPISDLYKPRRLIDLLSCRVHKLEEPKNIPQSQISQRIAIHHFDDHISSNGTRPSELHSTSSYRTSRILNFPAYIDTMVQENAFPTAPYQSSYIDATNDSYTTDSSVSCQALSLPERLTYTVSTALMSLSSFSEHLPLEEKLSSNSYYSRF